MSRFEEFHIALDDFRCHDAILPGDTWESNNVGPWEKRERVRIVDLSLDGFVRYRRAWSWGRRTLHRSAFTLLYRRVAPTA